MLYLEAKCNELESSLARIGNNTSFISESEGGRGNGERTGELFLTEEVQKPLRDLCVNHSSVKSDLRVLLDEMNRDMETTFTRVLDATRVAQEAKQAVQNQLREEQERAEQATASMIDAQTILGKEQAERRKLLNKVIELQGNIRVYCRVRPLSTKELNENQHNIVKFPADSQLTLVDPSSTTGHKNHFDFDKVFDTDSSQEQVFADVAPFVMSAVDGYNVCVFAYGQTGSGKTHTMEGPKEDRGVNFRALDELFKITAERANNFQYEVTLSCVEIYNEMPRDLLMDPSEYSSAKLDIRQKNGKVFIPGLTATPVTTSDQVLDILQNQVCVSSLTNRYIFNGEFATIHLFFPSVGVLLLKRTPFRRMRTARSA